MRGEFADDDAQVFDVELGEVALDFAEDGFGFHLEELDPAGVVGFDDEDAVADVAGAGVGGDVDAGELFPAGEEAVVLVGAVDLGVVEVGFEDFADALGALGGAAAEFGPVGDGAGGLRLGGSFILGRPGGWAGLLIRPGGLVVASGVGAVVYLVGPVSVGGLVVLVGLAVLLVGPCWLAGGLFVLAALLVGVGLVAPGGLSVLVVPVGLGVLVVFIFWIHPFSTQYTAVGSMCSGDSGDSGAVGSFVAFGAFGSPGAGPRPVDPAVPAAAVFPVVPASSRYFSSGKKVKKACSYSGSWARKRLRRSLSSSSRTSSSSKIGRRPVFSEK